MEEAALEHHVDELRSRLLQSVLFFSVAAAAGYYFSPSLLGWLEADLGLSLHALTAYEVFYTQLTIAMLLGLGLSLPILTYHLLMFVKPGLRETEYRVLRNALPLSYLLFGLGLVFGYQVAVKTALSFFESTTASSGIAAVWGLKSTLGFAMKLSFATGLVFQIPVLALAMGRAGLIDAGMMRSYRSYFVVAALVLAAAVSPPDILSQLLIGLPVLGLYEASIFLVARVQR